MKYSKEARRIKVWARSVVLGNASVCPVEPPINNRLPVHTATQSKTLVSLVHCCIVSILVCPFASTYSDWHSDCHARRNLLPPGPAARHTKVDFMTVAP